MTKEGKDDLLKGLEEMRRKANLMEEKAKKPMLENEGMREAYDQLAPSEILSFKPSLILPSKFIRSKAFWTNVLVACPVRNQNHRMISLDGAELKALKIKNPPSIDFVFLGFRSRQEKMSLLRALTNVPVLFSSVKIRRVTQVDIQMSLSICLSFYFKWYEVRLWPYF